MTVGSNTLYFTYDASGSPLAVTYNGTTYYYALNLQGDVMAILNASGTAVVQYTYDAWGKLLTTTGTMETTLGVHNPLRYCGYVYDHETSCIICKAVITTPRRVGLSMQIRLQIRGSDYWAITCLLTASIIL